MARTHAANLFSTELTSEMGATSLTAQVLSTSGGPASPALLVIDPPEDETTAARTEVVLFDGTFTGTSFVIAPASGLANRYQQGSAAPSGITHPVGAKVLSAPLGTQLEDLWDAVDAHGGGSGLAHGATSSPTASTIMARDANSRSQVASPAVSNDIANRGYVDSHSNATSVHSATSAATASRLVLRDGSGRAQFASPSASADAATKGYVDGFDPSPARGRFYRHPSSGGGAQGVSNETIVTVGIDTVQGTSTVGSISGGGTLTLSVGGTFLIGATIAWDQNATGYRWIGIDRNDTELVYDARAAAPLLATVQSAQVFQVCSSGDTIRVKARHNRGGSLSLINADAYQGRLSCRLWVIRIAP